LEILSALKDRKTQELLLDGIRKPRQALVPVDHALRLLSSDIHSDVLEVARRLATDQQSRKNKPVFLQALRVLASDPASVGRLEEVLANDSHSIDARRLAATALHHLSPESLNSRTARSVSAAKVGRKRKGAADRRGVADRKGAPDRKGAADLRGEPDRNGADRKAVTVAGPTRSEAPDLHPPAISPSRPPTVDPVDLNFRLARKKYFAAWESARETRVKEVNALNAERKKAEAAAPRNENAPQGRGGAQRGQQKAVAPKPPDPQTQEVMARFWGAVEGAAREFAKAGDEGLAAAQKAGVSDPPRLNALRAAQAAGRKLSTREVSSQSYLPQHASVRMRMAAERAFQRFSHPHLHGGLEYVANLRRCPGLHDSLTELCQRGIDLGGCRLVGKGLDSALDLLMKRHVLLGTLLKLGHLWDAGFGGLRRPRAVQRDDEGRTGCQRCQPARD
jgi:hypothetical protein